MPLEGHQAIELLWAEWKYRHELFWKSIFRWAGAVLTLWVIPFLKPEIFKPWPWVALAFPSAAFMLSILSAWIIGAEHRRFKAVNDKFQTMRTDLGFAPPPMSKDTLLEKTFARAVGAAIIWFYAFSFSIISVLIAMLIIYSIWGSTPQPPSPSWHWDW